MSEERSGRSAFQLASLWAPLRRSWKGVRADACLHTYSLYLSSSPYCDLSAVVLPNCLHVFHAEPCIRSYLSTNNRCPTCSAPLM